MLDSAQYRLSERIAKQQLPTWRIAQRHSLEVFEKAGFPVRVESLADLRPLIDTMQENRFDSYMRELGGLTPACETLLMKALHEICFFQLTYFNSQEIIVPFSTLMSQASPHLRFIQENQRLRKIAIILIPLGFFKMRGCLSIDVSPGDSS